MQISVPWPSSKCQEIQPRMKLFKGLIVSLIALLGAQSCACSLDLLLDASDGTSDYGLMPLKSMLGEDRQLPLTAKCGTLHDLGPSTVYKVHSTDFLFPSPKSKTLSWAFKCQTMAFSVKPGTKPLVGCFNFNLNCQREVLRVLSPGYKHAFCGQSLSNKFIKAIPVADQEFVLRINHQAKLPTRVAKFDCWVLGVAAATTEQQSSEENTTSTTAPPPQAQEQTKNCTCGLSNPNGISSNRIVGGNLTEPHEYPWFVTIKSSGRFICGGVIISRDWVLTAAHCCPYGPYSVSVANHDSGIVDPVEQEVAVDKVLVHPVYVDLDYDFGLMRLARPLEFNIHISAVCLPRSDIVTSAGQPATVMGHGTLEEGGRISAITQEVNVTLITNTECNQLYASYGGITDNMICALDKGKDACQGDSGGPLVVHNAVNNNRFTLVGLTSWGVGCAQIGYPGVYARVTSALPWIKEHVSNYCQP